MNQKTALHMIGVGLLALSMVSCGVGGASSPQSLPYFGPKDAVELPDGSVDTLYHTVPMFALTDQYGGEFSHRDLNGRIRIADCFFTHCPTICPAIASQLSRINDEIKANGWSPEVVIISHTVDPQRDKPARLQAYAERLGVTSDEWVFLTGKRGDLYEHIEQGHFLTALPSDTAEGGFYHSDQVVLIDRGGHIRGVYDGTDTPEMDDLLVDLQWLIENDPRP
jgi:protein SCO1